MKLTRTVSVCYYNNNIVGWAGVGTLGKKEGFGHISTYVLPEFRGKGVGSTLIKLVLEKYAAETHERNAIVIELEKDNSSLIKDIVESFGFECLPYFDDKYDYANDEIWDGRNPLLLGYHKYLTLKVIGCECPNCSKKQ